MVFALQSLLAQQMLNGSPVGVWLHFYFSSMCAVYLDCLLLQGFFFPLACRPAEAIKAKQQVPSYSKWAICISEYLLTGLNIFHRSFCNSRECSFQKCTSSFSRVGYCSAFTLLRNIKHLNLYKVIVFISSVIQLLINSELLIPYSPNFHTVHLSVLLKMEQTNNERTGNQNFEILSLRSSAILGQLICHPESQFPHL